MKYKNEWKEKEKKVKSEIIWLRLKKWKFWIKVVDKEYKKG